jgi:hypothetical protein
VRRTALILMIVVVACGGTTVPRAAPASSAAPATTSTSTTTTTIEPPVPTRPKKATTTTAVSAPPTQVIVFSAFNNGGPSSRLHVAQQTTGTCSQPASADAGRASAYRCFGDDGTIRDPCFTDDDGIAPYLLCFGQIADEETVQLTPNAPVAPTVDPDAMTTQPPWALDLADGQRCNFVQGGTEANDAGRLNYQCDNGVVFGSPDTSSASWTVAFRPGGGTALVPVPVAAAYY